MKFSCHDISQIYHKNIESKIGKLIGDQRKLEDAEGALNRLSDVDRDLISFVSDKIIRRLDDFVDRVQPVMLYNPPNLEPGFWVCVAVFSD